jgi:hypothetical protein
VDGEGVGIWVRVGEVRDGRGLGFDFEICLWHVCVCVCVCVMITITIERHPLVVTLINGSKRSRLYKTEAHIRNNSNHLKVLKCTLRPCHVNTIMPASEHMSRGCSGTCSSCKD